MKKLFQTITFSAAVALFAAGTMSCEREYDAPPAVDIPVGGVITLADLINLHPGYDTTFTQDVSIYCVATCDEVNGNFYKTVYVQDGTGAMALRLVSSGGIYRGDSIRLNLKGTTLKIYNDMLQLDSVDVDKNIVKQATGVEVTPEVVTISQLGPLYHSKLIQIDNVQFADSDAGQPYADAVNLQSVNRYLIDCSGNTVIVRTSGYANFAGSLTPTGSGSIIGIFGQFGSDLQMYIRNTSEVSMPNQRCIYLFKDFEDGSITSGGWTQQNVVAGINWTTNDAGSVYGDLYGQITNYSGGNTACETWLISPSLDLSGASIPFLEFKNACNYSGDNIAVKISTNYDGVSSTATATWTDLPGVSLSSGSWSWVSSGLVDLTGFKVNGVHIAIRYTGSASSGKTWEIDNILVGEL